MKKYVSAIGLLSGVLFVVSTALVGCAGGNNEATPVPVSRTGVKEATAEIQPGADGLTAEQRNVKLRLENDNKPGSIKHLYVFSAYSGQCILYSTVKGKVTSSGKRLTPNTVAAGVNYNGGQGPGWVAWGPQVKIGNELCRTTEVLQDDGTYGSSTEYLFWADSKQIYHQHYVSGGQIVHISNEPMPVKSIVVNIESSSAK